MQNVIQLPKRSDRDLSTYAGRIVSLNPERARTFQCGGFQLSPSRVSAVVPEGAQMESIRMALADGRLIDVTEAGEVKSDNSSLSTVNDMGATGKKAYFTKSGGGVTCIQTDNPEEQKMLEEQLGRGVKSLILPPGFEDQEKYMIRLDPITEEDLPTPKANAPRILSAKDQDAIDNYRALKVKTSRRGRLAAWLRKRRGK